MKLLLFLLGCLSYGFIMAQDCTKHLLMQKGAQLEYKVYMFKRDSSAGRAVARLLFEVEQVKDSAGSTWSTISKKGVGLFDPKDHYERKIVLQCDGKQLLLPYDFYQCDTLFTGDAYSAKPADDNYGYAKAYTPLEDAITYIIPFRLDCLVSLPEGKKRFVQKAKRGYSPMVICKVTPEGHEIEINSIKQEGKITVTTPAGTFSCYRFCVEYNGEYGPYMDWLYLNQEIGLIKIYEGSRSIELNNIRQ